MSGDSQNTAYDFPVEKNSRPAISTVSKDRSPVGYERQGGLKRNDRWKPRKPKHKLVS